MAIRKAPGYVTYGGSTTRPKPYVPPKVAVPTAAANRAANVAGLANANRQLTGFVNKITNYPSLLGNVSSYTNIPGVTPVDTGPRTGVQGQTVPVPRSTVPGNYTASLDEILGNPLSQEALGSYNTGMQSFMRALKSGIGQKIISSGYDPSAAFAQLRASNPDLGDFTDLIDPASIAAANANPLSERALAEQNYNTGMSNLDYQLAGAGILGSGAQATGGNQLLQAKQLSEQASRANLMNAISGGLSDYLQQKTSGYNRLQDVYAQVAQLLANRAGAVPETGTEELPPEGETPTGEETIPGTTVPSAASVPSSGVQWGGQTFTTRAALSRWLASHGSNWGAWAANHPAAAARLS
jgi:hypothetical protein